MIAPMERKAKNIYWFSWRWITVGQTHQYWSGLIVTRCSIPLSSLHLSSHCFFLILLYFLYLYFISLYSFSSLHLCLSLECWSIGLTSKDLVLYTFFISLCLVLGICCMHIFSSIFGDNLVFSLLQGSTFRLMFSNLELTQDNVLQAHML